MMTGQLYFEWKSWWVLAIMPWNGYSGRNNSYVSLFNSMTPFLMFKSINFIEFFFLYSSFAFFSQNFQWNQYRQRLKDKIRGHCYVGKIIIIVYNCCFNLTKDMISIQPVNMPQNRNMDLPQSIESLKKLFPSTRHIPRCRWKKFPSCNEGTVKAVLSPPSLLSPPLW